MSNFANSTGTTALANEPVEGVETRIRRTMILVVGFSGAAGAIFAPWRVAAGLVLGGLLSLLSHHWMKSSVAAAFSVAAGGTKPQIGVVRYILRYFVIGTVVFAAYILNLVSLPATLVGLCSFVAALFVEAAREFYLTIVHREEIG